MFQETDNHYFGYSALARKNMLPDVHGVIIIPEKNLRVIRVYKKPIGAIDQFNAIDAFGNLFKTDASKMITVHGDYTKWPDLYQALENTKLIHLIYKVHIKKFHVEIWLSSNTLILLHNVQDLIEFYALYPNFFQENHKIDLRNTKRVAISMLKSNIIESKSKTAEKTALPKSNQTKKK